MMGFWSTFKRELGALWFTPLAWVLLVLLLIVQGTVFSSVVGSFAEGAELLAEIGPLEAFYGSGALAPLSHLLLCPALAMRTFAEERRTGTIENLLSAPVSMAAIVLGKYAACVLSFGLLWLPSVTFVFILNQMVEVDWRTATAAYCGILGQAAGLIAAGVLISTLTRSQILSLTLTAGLLIAVLVLGVAEPLLESDAVRSFAQHVSIQAQMGEMSRGIISVRYVVYDLSLVVLPLFVATRIVAAWRWS